MRFFLSILICVMVLMGVIICLAIMHPQMAVYCLYGLGFMTFCVLLSGLIYAIAESD